MWRILDTARAIRKRTCRRSSMSPAPMARARPSPISAPVIEAAGLSVHCYTSPHLVKFHERIRIGWPGGGMLISEDKLIALLEECEQANGGDTDHLLRDHHRRGLPRLRAHRRPIISCSKWASAAGSMPPMSYQSPSSASSRPSTTTISNISATPSPRSRARRPAS